VWLKANAEVTRDEGACTHGNKNNENAAPIGDYPRTWCDSIRPRELHTTLATLDDIQWNFEKFLISRDGKRVRRFAQWMKPKQITEQIEEELNVGAKKAKK
jgi:glutathione peroxidase-family protein